MRLSQLLAKERTIEVEIDGDTLTITYDPSAFTAEAEDRYAAQRETARNIGAMAEALDILLIKWDLTDEDGKTLPINTETLRTLPGEFLGRVMEAINEDASPKQKRGRNSRGG